MKLQYLGLVDTLMVELDKETCPLIIDITNKFGVNNEDAAGLLIMGFRNHFLPRNPMALNVLYTTQDDGQYHIDHEHAEQFISYLNFAFKTTGLPNVSLIVKEKR